MNSESRARSRKGRRANRTGRSIGTAQHVRLYRWMTQCPAWCSLAAQSRAVYLEIAQRFNGGNNGEISLSVREAAQLVHIAKDTASKCFHELENKGFIRRHVCGSFNWKARHATTWVLTEHPFGDKAATRDFLRWPQSSEPGPKSDPNCPKPGTKLFVAATASFESVRCLGPWAQSSTAAQSQLAARMYFARPVSAELVFRLYLMPVLLLWNSMYRRSGHRAVGTAPVIWRMLLGVGQ